MSETGKQQKEIVLNAIAKELQAYGEEIVATVELSGERVSACDRQLRIEVASIELNPDNQFAHCHIVSQIGSDTSRNIDACLIGIGPSLEDQLKNAAQAWNLQVAAPILSLMSQNNLQDTFFFDGQGTTGIRNANGFAGPPLGREISGQIDWESLANINLFEHVDAMAPPEYLQLAKVVLVSDGTRWLRNIEINGHHISVTDDDWHPEIRAPEVATISQFAVFHFATNPDWVDQRQQTDNAICQFIAAFSESQKVDLAITKLEGLGVSNELIHQVHSFVSLALSRFVFADLGATYSSHFHRITNQGNVNSVKLLSEPVFARSLAMSPEFLAGDMAETCKTLALLNTEFNHLNDLMNDGQVPQKIELESPVIPDHDVSTKTLELAMKKILKL